MVCLPPNFSLEVAHVVANDFSAPAAGRSGDARTRPLAVTIPRGGRLRSTEPFCLDTMEPLQWLQWVFMPRFYALLESGAPLPQNFAIAPYYEVALPADTPGYAVLLLTLNKFDALFQEPSA